MAGWEGIWKIPICYCETKVGEARGWGPRSEKLSGSELGHVDCEEVMGSGSPCAGGTRVPGWEKLFDR